MTADLLVIGYGNELRGDDGVGPHVARRVARWGRPGVRGVAVHQLTPELAADLSAVQRAIFVDAEATSSGAPRLSELDAGAGAGCGHASDPRWLLGLTRAVYGRAPRAWLLTVPVADLAFGEGLSAAARRGAAAALRLIRSLSLPTSTNSHASIS